MNGDPAEHHPPYATSPRLHRCLSVLPVFTPMLPLLLGPSRRSLCECNLGRILAVLDAPTLTACRRRGLRFRSAEATGELRGPARCRRQAHLDRAREARERMAPGTCPASGDRVRRGSTPAP